MGSPFSEYSKFDVVDCGMAVKPNAPGLLSKVANIFRPQDGRGGASVAKASKASQGAAPDSAQSPADVEKNALRALIQRKRQDDLIRRREFNYLRKLHKSPQGASIINHDPTDRISTFQTSSGFVVDDRASTIKKIDAIEAHMVSSWARSKVAQVMPDRRGGVPVPSGVPVFHPTSQPPLKASKPNPPAPPRQPIADKTDRHAWADDASTPPELDSMDLDFTGLLSAPGGTAIDTQYDNPENAPTQAAELRSASPEPGVTTATATDADAGMIQWNDSDFESPVKSAAAQHPAAPAPPQPLPENIESALQDAAIHFAEGDSGSAETILLGLLQDSDVSEAAADVLASALFDLYRATGQQDGFDVVAMDYAERFGRSPGEWFSLPELLEGHSEAAIIVPPQRAAVAAQDKVWESPGVLTCAAITDLRAHFTGPQAEWHVDWIALTDIEVDAAPMLAELFVYWSSHALELHWSGVESLINTLEARAPGDDASVDPLWWQLRLDALCILQQHDDFESLALEFCVLFEVSPPSWKASLCTFVRDQSASVFATLVDGPSSVPVDDSPSLTAPFATCEMVGEVVGEAPEAMGRLRSSAESADHVVVSCALVVRMDFTAAGGVLNWVIELQSRGCYVQFIHVPRLVAVFFQLLGIDRYAQISVRAN